MSKQKAAAEFEKIINEGRERKRNQDLAARIFSNKDGQRRASAPASKHGAGGSLASRVGVNKRIPTGPRASAGNMNGEWTHDLHSTQAGRGRSQAQKPAPNSLAARTQRPGAPVPKTTKAAVPKTRPNRANKLANAYSRAAALPTNAPPQMNVVNQPAGAGSGFTIKGLAGPFAVLAQNFAPGTTAADIESALTPVGGLISSCRIVKTQPIVIAEIVFESKEGADRVIERFDQQVADGRTLAVYMKPGGYAPVAQPSAARVERTRETRLAGNSVLVDGTMGFDDHMDTDDAEQGLYSDKLVSSASRGLNNGHPLYQRDYGYQGRRRDDSQGNW